ncbi:MAG TPA: hypothetical protein VK505_04350, partial [Steroidobacteraceae bacterium]|nr:hypothetical protein [Steroidobacteraceae bacterium]
WTLQAISDLMDKNLGWGFTVLPSQIQAANAFLILIMVPIFTFGIYPVCNRYFNVTPLRKIGFGLFLVAASFLIVSWIESRIQSGHRVSVYWQLLAYVVLTASEVLVSITALEFSYRQAPLRMKSFIMALFLLSISAGNLMTAVVNDLMVRELPGSAVTSGEQTWVSLPAGTTMITGQKIDFNDHSGLTVRSSDGKEAPLAGTFLVAQVDGNRVRLMDNEHRQSVVTTGSWNPTGGVVSTYRLVGPQYFNFFAYVMAGFGVLFIGVAVLYRGQDHVRAD